MKPTTNAWLLLAVVVLGGFIWFVERRAPATGERRAQELRLVRLDADRVTAVEVDRGGVIECRKRGDGWRMVRPVEAPADGERIERLLDALSSMPRLEAVTEAQRKRRGLTLADYGLSNPLARIMALAPESRCEIFIGGPTPLADVVYAMEAGQSDVIATTTNILGLLPAQAADWRSRVLFPIDPALVSRLEIVRAGAGLVHLARRAGSWQIQQPLAAKADREKVLALIQALAGLRVQEFVSDGAADPNAYGLGPDDANQVAVWAEGDDTARRLLVGKRSADSGGRIYAKMQRSDSIYTVPESAISNVLVSADELRDRRILTFEAADVCRIRLEEGDRVVTMEKADAQWKITEPTPCVAADEAVLDLLSRLAALRVDAFLDESATNLALLGLQPPGFAVELARPAVNVRGEPKADEAFETTRLLFGSTLRHGDRIAAAVQNGGQPFEVAAAAVRSFWRVPPVAGSYSADPLIYRDRAILTLTPEKVRSIALIRSGREQAVQRVDGGWEPVGGTGTVQSAAIENVLSTVSTLRAIRIQDGRAQPLSALGLDASGTVLTLGLTGTEGIQKRLIIGRPARDGVYVSLQGQDLIFVVEKAVADVLTRDLLK